MSAQSAMNALTGSILGVVGTVGSVTGGVDALMDSKATKMRDNKLKTSKAIKERVSQRRVKIGGNV